MEKEPGTANAHRCLCWVAVVGIAEDFLVWRCDLNKAWEDATR